MALLLLLACLGAAAAGCLFLIAWRLRARRRGRDAPPSGAGRTVTRSGGERPEGPREEGDAFAVAAAEETGPIGDAVEGGSTGAGPELAPDEVEASGETQRASGEDKTGQTATESSVQTAVAPIDRGGRPRGHLSERADRSEQTGVRPKRRLRPEIVCWKEGMHWVIGVEAPEELRDDNGSLPRVVQGSTELTSDESGQGRWRLERLSEPIEVQCGEGDTYVLDVWGKTTGERIVLFKLVGLKKSWGRRVNKPTAGLFLVVVPEDWERHDQLSGLPPIEAEPLRPRGYRAHFFDLSTEADVKIAFSRPNGSIVQTETPEPIFSLVGNRIPDADEDAGPLFGEGPPKLRGRGPEAWGEIATTVVGEEGEALDSKRWRVQFDPQPEDECLDLPMEVGERRAGWYFVRLYDSSDQLVDSMDFRFVRDLRGLDIEDHSAFPESRGHCPITVCFSHGPACTVRGTHAAAGCVLVATREDGTSLTVSPSPECDRTCWWIGPAGGPEVQVTVLVERVWWAHADERGEPTELEWIDQPINIARESFAPTSGEALWLRFPRRRWTDTIHAGFERARARPYSPKVTETVLAIPLREFADSPEIKDCENEAQLAIWLDLAEEQHACIVAYLPSRRPAEHVAWGRKGTAVARAEIRGGRGAILIAGEEVSEYLGRVERVGKAFLQRLLDLPDLRGIFQSVDIRVELWGATPSGTRQVKAATHAIARALSRYSPDLRGMLRRNGFGGCRTTERTRKRCGIGRHAEADDIG